VGDGGTALDARRHWDIVYGADPTVVSWYQPSPALSLELIDALGVGPRAPVIDVGGGASTLVDELLRRGFGDVSVLDVSGAALDTARRRLGEAAARVHWLQEDLRRWSPARRYGLWHDRAVFHFLVERADQDRYRRLLASAVQPAGAAVIAAFGPSGPSQCSGLPVVRYGIEELAAAAGDGFELVSARHEDHTTPAGAVQPFVWVALRSRSA
jgi:SAM-dependent methyltransferase